jgi:hypothetical protein
MKQNLLKTMLVSTALVAGTMGVWADEVQLLPTDDTYLDFSNPAAKYGEEKALLSGVWKEMWTDRTPGLKKYNIDRVVLMKFNVKDYVGKITGATLKVTGTNSNKYNREVRLGYFDLNSWDEKTVTATSSQMVTRDAKKLNIHPFDCAVTLTALSTKEYAFSTNNLLEYLNNNADKDGNVSLIIYSTAVECSFASKESDTKPSLVLEYSAAKLYSVDFSESNGVTPEVKVYSDAACSTEVSASALTAGTKYYYVATLAGYEDYKGEFTVASENPSVSFTMVKKPIFAYKVDLVDEANKVLKTVYENNEAYEGLEVNYSYPKYLTDENGKVTYVCSLSSFNGSVKAHKDAVTSVKYNEYKGTAYFVEAENAINQTKVESANYSSGAAMRGFDKKNVDLFTVPETAVYRLSYAICSNNLNESRQFFVSAGDEVIVNKVVNWSVNDVIKKGTMTEAAMTFNEGTVIKAKGSDTNIILDYILLEKVTSEDVAVSSVKFATYVPTFNVVAPADVKVYTAKVNEAKSAVVLTEVPTGSVIAKGTPVLVGAEAGSYNFAASTREATAVADNDLKAATADTKGDGSTIYALVEQDGKAVFAPLKEGVAVSLGHAYLELPAASATRFYSIQFGGETTGINEVNAAAKADGAYYTLQGVKTSKAAKGIYIHNGKKVVIK